jgi:F-type H+-transporting ATPase subunit a
MTLAQEAVQDTTHAAPAQAVDEVLHQAAEQAEHGLDLGEVILHHTADAWTIDLYPFGAIHLPRFEDIHLAGMTINLSPTKHVVFMMLAAALVFLVMWLTGRMLEKQRAGEQAPHGFAAAMEAFVLWVRNDIAIANIGHHGAKFAPLIMALFFFILFANVMGLLPPPLNVSPTGNLAVTAALAILVFLTVEISGMVTLGPKGYMRTIFPNVPGMSGGMALVMSIAMAPIEVIGKLVKPFALAVRLFGNMTAGHFVILALFGIIFLFGSLPYGANWGIGITTAALVTAIMMLELFVAFLQAYVFALLSAVFIGLMQHEH